VFHNKGRKRKHTFEVIIEAVEFPEAEENAPVLCQLCERRVATESCENSCHFNGCNSVCISLSKYFVKIFVLIYYYISATNAFISLTVIYYMLLYRGKRSLISNVLYVGNVLINNVFNVLIIIAL
jgi:hypothetical protein